MSKKVVKSSWTAEHDAQLEEWKHLGVETVAKRLNRTPAAIRNRIHRLKNGHTKPHDVVKTATPVLKPKAVIRKHILDKLHRIQAEIMVLQVKEKAYEELLKEF